MLTESEQTIVDDRQNAIDYVRIEKLQYLGNYVRRLPVNMARMMENALDWEHLAHVHGSSFSAIDVVAQGRWGWRAKAALNAGTQETQLLELLVDHAKNYWATTVLAGPASNVEIHTQASSISDTEIEVDVRFYSSSTLAPETATMYADVLQQQYALLYDEDAQLMSGRQTALDNSAAWREQRGATGGSAVLVGEVSALSLTEPTVVETPIGRYCVRHYEGDWIVHSAVCAHLLGPLDATTVDTDGSVTCPWHGYRFDVRSGANLDKKCRALEAPPALVELEGSFYLEVS